MSQDRVVKELAALTLQLSRVAWAIEVSHSAQRPRIDYQEDPCTICGSQLVLVPQGPGEKCGACRAPVPFKSEMSEVHHA